MRKFAIVALLFFASFCQADFVVPKQTLTGADKPVPLGELASLNITPPEKVAGLVSTSYTWKILDGSKDWPYRLDVDGNVIFASGLKNKSLLVVVGITHVYEVVDADKKLKQYATKTVLLVSGLGLGEPSPPPPPPGPVLPDGKFKAAKAAYDAAVSKVPADNRVKGAKALVNSFRGIASAIAAGTLTDPKVILTTTTEKNRFALADAAIDKTVWSAFFDVLQPVIFDLYDQGKVSSASDFKDLWNEIAVGLDAVK
jgi:hypothetical protein